MLVLVFTKLMITYNEFVQEKQRFVTTYSSECFSPSVAVCSTIFKPPPSSLLQSIDIWTGPGLYINKIIVYLRVQITKSCLTVVIKSHSFYLVHPLSCMTLAAHAVGHTYMQLTDTPLPQQYCMLTTLKEYIINREGEYPTPYSAVQMRCG